MNWRVTVSVVGCVLLGACGGSDTPVDTARLADDVTSTLDRKADGEPRVESVDCPKAPASKAGTTFVCTFTFTDGSDGEVTVVVRDDEGGARWDVTRPASGQVEREILQDLEAEGTGVAAVRCGDPIKVGGVTDCVVNLRAGGTRDVVVRTAEDGSYRWRTR